MNAPTLTSSAKADATSVPSLADSWRRFRDAWRNRRRMAATRLSLSSLSDRTLHDLGLARAEAGSIASELHGLVEAQRVRSGSAGHGGRQP
jgi:uncharacterized protein YjiS (DUF1127 family)